MLVDFKCGHYNVCCGHQVSALAKLAQKRDMLGMEALTIDKYQVRRGIAMHKPKVLTPFHLIWCLATNMLKLRRVVTRSAYWCRWSAPTRAGKQVACWRTGVGSMWRSHGRAQSWCTSVTHIASDA
jgi:hypothetical protein